MFKNCLKCNKEFKKTPSNSKEYFLNKKKYCSKSCSSLAKIGRSVNKGRVYSEEQRRQMSERSKGQRHSPDTEFKKGNPGHWLGKKRGNMMDEQHPNYKGEKVSYSGLHKWVTDRLGKPRHCAYCQDDTKKGDRMYQWANISHSYKRELSDWIRLCAKCHKAYDMGKISLNNQF